MITAVLVIPVLDAIAETGQIYRVVCDPVRQGQQALERHYQNP
jgi:hypothetical protein